MRLSARAANALGFLVCVALLAYAFYSQFHDGLEPCPLCIFGRVSIMALGVAFLLAAVHDPAGRQGRLAYTLLIALAAAVAVGISARHVYIQMQPPGTVASCGAPLEFMMQSLPLTTVIRRVLTGSGECSAINWQFLGLTMPGWVLVWALLLGAWGIYVNLRARR